MDKQKETIKRLAQQEICRLKTQLVALEHEGWDEDDRGVIETYLNEKLSRTTLVYDIADQIEFKSETPCLKN